MKVDRSVLASGAAVQFSTLALVGNPDTRAVGFVAGMIMGSILLLLAIDLKPRTVFTRRRESKANQHD